MKKRLFTFGCSHTHHIWPSWANILSLGFNEFYNFGAPGTGDFRILNQVMRANEHFKFNNNDYIGIGLSCNFRYDIIKENPKNPKDREWMSLGSMLDDNYHTPKFQSQLTESGGNENKLTIVKSIKEILNKKDNPKYKIFQTFDMIEKSTELLNELDSQKTLYDYSYSYGQQNSYKIDGNWNGHYSIPVHLDLVKEQFSDWYDTKNDDVVLDWHNHMPKTIDSLSKKFNWLKYEQYYMIGTKLINPYSDV